jgi:penicillin-binding protein 1C
LWLADRIWPLPMPGDDLARVVLAEDGTPLWRFADADGVWRYPVSPDEVSPLYLQALLTYEDRWFYSHPGVNPLALARAAWLNLRGGRVVSGGSTLSMQVARLLDPHDRTLAGKLRQLWRTAQLEWHLSKREILQIYLDRAPFGGTLQGVAAASWAYLGKSPLHLTPAEAALLAVLPQAPSRLRPDRHPSVPSVPATRCCSAWPNTRCGLHSKSRGGRGAAGARPAPGAGPGAACWPGA